MRQLYPQAKIGFGPPIEDGFYYDFEVERPFGPEDLEAIEKRMGEVVKADYPFVREEVSRAEAKQRFKDDPLKLERIDDLGPNEIISVYTDGPFVDLCRGPHVPSTGRIKHFKLLHAAGAYWRGDERRQMLQRIYGTAWFSKDDLDAYVRRLEEAKKRDHRILGKQLDLFSIQEDVGPGLILWHPKGAILQFQLRRFIARRSPTPAWMRKSSKQRDAPASRHSFWWIHKARELSFGSVTSDWRFSLANSNVSGSPTLAPFWWTATIRPQQSRPRVGHATRTYR